MEMQFLLHLLLFIQLIVQGMENYIYICVCVCVCTYNGNAIPTASFTFYSINCTRYGKVYIYICTYNGNAIPTASFTFYSINCTRYGKLYIYTMEMQFLPHLLLFIQLIVQGMENYRNSINIYIKL